MTQNKPQILILILKYHYQFDPVIKSILRPFLASFLDATL